MKKAAVATTTASGAAVSSSRMTAVQSVYIPALQVGATIIPALPPFPAMARLPAALIVLGLLSLPLAAVAQVRFIDCAPTPDGGISCDTQPEGDTLLDDEAARFGLFQGASPGWNEFLPYGDGDGD